VEVIASIMNSLPNKFSIETIKVPWRFVLSITTQTESNILLIKSFFGELILSPFLMNFPTTNSKHFLGLGWSHHEWIVTIHWFVEMKCEKVVFLWKETWDHRKRICKISCKVRPLTMKKIWEDKHFFFLLLYPVIKN